MNTLKVVMVPCESQDIDTYPYLGLNNVRSRVAQESGYVSLRMTHRFK